MSLVGLPNELIEAISNHLPTYRDVGCLARASRRFYAFVNNYLYRRNHVAEEGSKRDALFWAASNARMDTFLRAEALGIPIRAPSLLAEASRGGHLHIVKFLFPRVRRDRVKPHDNALVDAYDNSNFDVLRFLADSGADLDAVGGEDMAVLHLAACEGDVANMELLLDRGADADVLGDFDWTPLHFACEAGEVAAMGLLLGRGADIGAVDRGLDTPLHLAAWSGCLEGVKLLLEKGADLSRENEDGWTPALVAIESYVENTDVVAKYLLKVAEG